VSWAREQGVGRLVEEDRLNPLERFSASWSKAAWRRNHHVAPNAVPVYLVGVQRSGTNMLARGFERSAEFEIRNENDPAAFERFLLRPDAEVRALVERSGQRYVLFKPLCDSHRVAGLLDGLGTPSPGRAVWAYRGVDDRVRSAISKFGDANLRALANIAAGRGLDTWQAGGLSPERLEQIAGFDYTSMSAESGAALFWFVRNSLYFDLGLDARDDVALASYDDMVASPEPAMRRLCAFLNFPFDGRLVAHIDPRSTTERAPLVIDPQIRALCSELGEHLAHCYDQRAAT
jgi:hypothetical protein